MPLVTGGGGVNIPIEGDASSIIAASNATIKELDKLKEKVKANGKELEAAAKKEQAAIQKTAEKYKNSLAPGLQKAQDAVSKFMSANTALIGVTVAVGAAVVKSYQAFQQYAGSVRDVALASGASAEQASLFLQVLDDFEVSAQDVSSSMRAMTKNGLTPTLDTLAKLADQYVAIQDPMEKNKFLLDNLGKSGLSWANALSQGGDALRANAEEVNKNLILTDEQIKKAEQARLAVDAWTDSWEGFKVAVGSSVGGIIAANDEADKMRNTLMQMAPPINNSSAALADFERRLDRFTNQMERGEALTDYVKKLYGIKDAADSTGASLEDLSKANESLIKDAISIQDANDKYNDSQQETLDKIAELQKKKEELYPWERDEIKKISEQIDEQKEKYAESAEEFGKAQGEKLVMLALEKIAVSDGVAGYSEAEMAKAEMLLNTAGIAEDSAFRQALAFEKASSALADGTANAQELHDLLKMMSEHGWTIDVAVNVQKSADIAAGVGTQTAGQQSVGWQGGMWTGGKLGSFAGGGGAAGWGVVGDRQGGGFIPGVSELIFGNARVFNSRQSEKMLKSGMFGNVRGFAEGGDTDRYTNPISLPPPPPPPARVVVRTKDRTKRGDGGSDDSVQAVSAAVQAVESQAAEMQSATQAVVQQVAMQFQQMTQQLLQSNQANADALGNIASILLTANPKAVGQEVAYEVSKRS